MKLANTSISILLIIGLFLLSSLFMSASSDELDTKGMIFVDDNADPSWYDATHVKTIQEGINNASSGDTVYVYNGTYYENIIVNKTIELIGENRDNTIIDGGGSDDVIYISSNNVLIRNFTIQGHNIYKSNKDIDCDAGIDVRSDYNTIENNCILDNYCGIFL